ncbi:fimbrial protein [Escherichia coli]|nr:fimbrial protein [Escherichia coli]
MVVDIGQYRHATHLHIQRCRGFRVQKSSDHSILDLTSGSWLPFNFSSGIPALEAVPVKQSGTTLAAAEFNASATIVVDYQ